MARRMWRLMWFPNRRASGQNLWATLALLLFLAAIQPTVSVAQPAADSADIGKPVLLAVRINGIDSGDAVFLLLPDGRLAVPEASLRAWHLMPPVGDALDADGKIWFRLDDIDGVSYRVDAAGQTLLLHAPPAAFTATSIAGDSATLRPTPAQPGGFLNYDLQWLRGGGRDSGSGLFELGAFNAWGSGTATALWNGASSNKPWVRLDTSWNFDVPERMQSLRLGDTIGRAGTWGRAVRFGGVQWGTNFATQPNFITFPLPALRGEAALPSTFDVYIDNVRRLHGDVPPGPFDLSSVPVITGQGQIQLVVRDLLGRQQVITQPYYASQRLLKPGLHDFSIDAGAVRENYGIDSANYGRFMLAATERLGISPGFTRELRAEVLRDQQTLGAGGVWMLPSFGIASLAAAISNGPDGAGRLLSASIERQAKDISFSLHAQYAERNFVQLGLTPTFAPRRILSASLGFPVGGNGLVVGYLQQSIWQGNENRLLSANYSLRLGQRSQLGFYALRNFAGEPNLTAGVMLTLVLDERTTASADMSRFGEHNQTTLQMQRNLPAGNGFGYRLLAGQGQFDRLGASAAWRTERGDISAEAARFSGSDAYRVGFSGGVAVAGGGAFLSRRIDDSFAVVKVDDYPDVRVYRDNQEVTRTDRRGLALITGLRAYQENPISIEQADLPLDAEVDSLQLKLIPPFRSGVVAAFPARRSRAATFRLVGEDGRPLPAGATVRLDGQDKEFPVGYDGKTFVTGLAPHNRLLGEWKGGRCVADLDFARESEPMPDLGTVICKGVTQ